MPEEFDDFSLHGGILFFVYFYLTFGEQVFSICAHLCSQ